MCTFPDGKYYVTVGANYYRYTDVTQTSPDPGYPYPIKGHFISADMGPKMEGFFDGFDSMCVFPNGYLYVTKGDQYARFSMASGGPIFDQGPIPLTSGWANLPAAFQSGFDSMNILPNGKLYITKGNLYLRYSDPSQSVADEGYPRAINGDSWGITPDAAQFLNGFNSMTTVGNLTYVTNGDQYIRYSDVDAFVIDTNPPYPLTLLEGWGV